jgi:hypothetical protein
MHWAAVVPGDCNMQPDGDKSLHLTITLISWEPEMQLMTVTSECGHISLR